MDAPKNWKNKAFNRRPTVWMGKRSREQILFAYLIIFVIDTFFNCFYTIQIEEETGQVIFIDSKNQRKTYIDPRLAFAQENSPKSIGDIRQRFDANTTAFQVLHGKDLTGKIAVVTGANTGIGFETARSLAYFGCRVLLACRSQAKAEEAIEKIRVERNAAGERCSFVPLDLESLASVEKATQIIKSKVSHIDMLILNAAVFALPYTQTVDGLETIFQVCHLSHFYLCELLEGLLDSRSRVVVVSSESHRWVFTIAYCSSPNLWLL